VEHFIEEYDTVPENAEEILDYTMRNAPIMVNAVPFVALAVVSAIGFRFILKVTIFRGIIYAVGLSFALFVILVAIVNFRVSK
jgi:hypothetical protein